MLCGSWPPVRRTAGVAHRPFCARRCNPRSEDLELRFAWKIAAPFRETTDRRNALAISEVSAGGALGARQTTASGEAGHSFSAADLATFDQRLSLNRLASLISSTFYRWEKT